MASSVWINPFGGFSFNGSSVVFGFPGLFPDGTAALPGIAFANEPSSGLQRVGAGSVSLQVLGVSRFSADTASSFVRGTDGGAYFYVTSSVLQVAVNSAALVLANGGSPMVIFSNPAVSGKFNITNGNVTAGIGFDVTTDSLLLFRTRAQSGAGGIGFASLAVSGTAPTIASGFGASPSVVASNGTAAFTVNVGTGGAASSGVLTMPAATTGWVVQATDLTNAALFVTVQTAGSTTSVTLTNYSRTTGLAIAWTASDVLSCVATAY